MFTQATINFETIWLNAIKHDEEANWKLEKHKIHFFQIYDTNSRAILAQKLSTSNM